MIVNYYSMVFMLSRWKLYSLTLLFSLWPLNLFFIKQFKMYIDVKNSKHKLYIKVINLPVY